MNRRYYDEFNPKSENFDLEMTCKNSLCGLYFEPVFHNHVLKKVQISDTCVYIGYVNFYCPSCTTLYNGITLAEKMIDGKISDLMFLQEPKLIELGSLVVAS
jgi:hypothetical protein